MDLTTFLSLLQENMNIQYVTGTDAMIIYLILYYCKAENTLSELVTKAAKKTTGKKVMQKLHAIGNMNKRENVMTMPKCIDISIIILLIKRIDTF